MFTWVLDNFRHIQLSQLITKIFVDLLLVSYHSPYFLIDSSNTTRISGCWREYQGPQIFFPEFSFTHATVNHSINFIDPNDPTIHTPSIEGFLSILKQKLRIYGTNLGDTLNAHLIEILYRRIHGQADDSYSVHKGSCGNPLDY